MAGVGGVGPSFTFCSLGDGVVRIDFSNSAALQALNPPPEPAPTPKKVEANATPTAPPAKPNENDWPVAPASAPATGTTTTTTTKPDVAEKGEVETDKAADSEGDGSIWSMGGKSSQALASPWENHVPPPLDLKRRMRIELLPPEESEGGVEGLAKAFMAMAEGGRVTHTEVVNHRPKYAGTRWVMSDLCDVEITKKFADVRLWQTTGHFLAVLSVVLDGEAIPIWESPITEIDVGSVLLEVTGTGYYVGGTTRGVKLGDATYGRYYPSKDHTPGRFLAPNEMDEKVKKGWTMEYGLNFLVLDRKTLKPIYDRTLNTYAYGRTKAAGDEFRSLCEAFAGSEFEAHHEHESPFPSMSENIFIVTSFHGFEVEQKSLTGNPLYEGPHAIISRSLRSGGGSSAEMNPLKRRASQVDDKGATEEDSDNEDNEVDEPLIDSSVSYTESISSEDALCDIFARLGVSGHDIETLRPLATLKSRSDAKGCQPLSSISFGMKEANGKMCLPPFHSKKVSNMKVLLCFDERKGQWLPFLFGKGEDNMAYWSTDRERTLADFYPFLRVFGKVIRQLPNILVRDLIKVMLDAAIAAIGRQSELSQEEMEALIEMHNMITYIFEMGDDELSNQLYSEGVVEWVCGRICARLPLQVGEANVERVTPENHEELFAAIRVLKFASQGERMAEALRRQCGEAYLRIVMAGMAFRIPDPIYMASTASIGTQKVRFYHRGPSGKESLAHAIRCGESGPPSESPVLEGTIWIEELATPEGSQPKLLNLDEFVSADRSHCVLLLRPKSGSSMEMMRSATYIAQQASRLVWLASSVGVVAVILLWPSSCGVHLQKNPNFLSPQNSLTKHEVPFLLIPAESATLFASLESGENANVDAQIFPCTEGGFDWQCRRRCRNALQLQLNRGAGLARQDSMRKRFASCVNETGIESSLRSRTNSLVMSRPRHGSISDRIFPRLHEEIDANETNADEKAQTAGILIRHLGGLHSGFEKPPNDGPIRILSLDGGGVRGFATLEMLDVICKAADQDVASLFDFIAGTSTGGIIAVACGIFNFSIERTKDMYKESADRIFKEEPWSSFLTKGPGYQAAANLEKVIEDYIGEDAQKPMMHNNAENKVPKVCTVSTLVSRAPSMHYVFRNYRIPSPGMVSRDGHINGDHNGSSIAAIRASSAAPYYLSELNLSKNLLTGEYTLASQEEAQGQTSTAAALTPRHQKPASNLTFVDGAITANNPTAIAIHEVRRIYGPDVPLVIVSLGTGRVTPHEAYLGDTRSSRFPSWVLNIIMSTGDVDSTDAGVKHSLGKSDVYERFNPTGDCFGCSIDDVGAETLEALSEGGKTYMRAQEARVAKLVELLRQ